LYISSVFCRRAAMDLFTKKPTAKEQMRQTDRVIRKTQRDMERERADLDRQEKKNWKLK
jgi:charged multivesicular body protein 2B